ncbi:MAG: hypothetical protein ACYYK0_01820 [Candidatus Eutrophobiaceae bacterium]
MAIDLSYEDDGSLSREELLALMDEALYQSLNQHGSCQKQLSTSNDGEGASGGSASNGGGEDASGKSASDDGGEHSESGEQAMESVANTQIMGKAKDLPQPESPSKQRQAEQQETQVDDILQPNESKGEPMPPTTVNHQKKTQGIPSTDNNAALVAELKELMAETKDPQTRAMLAKEIKKYE